MTRLRLQAWAAILALIITAAFAIHPGPYEMALFVFFAQPLFLIVFVSYGWRVVKDLRQKGVL
ncbi:MAG: hypothetical protein R3E76_12790 [Planctomycetota bacterium]